MQAGDLYGPGVVTEERPRVIFRRDATALIQKPFAPDALLKRVAELLEKAAA